MMIQYVYHRKHIFLPLEKSIWDFLLIIVPSTYINCVRKKETSRVKR